MTTRLNLKYLRQIYSKFEPEIKRSSSSGRNVHNGGVSYGIIVYIISLIIRIVRKPRM